MTDLLAQYNNPKLWKLDESQLPRKVYVSVPMDISGGMLWKREPAGPRKLTYTSGEYEIRAVSYGKTGRSYTVWRQGVELPLSLTGLLREAKARAVENARGEDRMNVA